MYAIFVSNVDLANAMATQNPFCSSFLYIKELTGHLKYRL